MSLYKRLHDVQSGAGHRAPTRPRIRCSTSCARRSTTT